MLGLEKLPLASITWKQLTKNGQLWVLLIWEKNWQASETFISDENESQGNGTANRNLHVDSVFVRAPKISQSYICLE